MSVHAAAMLNLLRLSEDDSETARAAWLQTLAVSPTHVRHAVSFLAGNGTGHASLKDAIRADIADQLEAQRRAVNAELAELKRCERVAAEIHYALQPKT
jgi:hypothetical protein